MKARTAVGRGKKSLLNDAGSEVRYRRKKEKINSAKVIDGMINKIKKAHTASFREKVSNLRQIIL